MDRHDPVDKGLFPRLQGRRVVALEYDRWAGEEERDWLGIEFDGGAYLSVYAVGGFGGGSGHEVGWLLIGTKRRCPEPFRDGTGQPVRRCRAFAGHGGSHE